MGPLVYIICFYKPRLQDLPTDLLFFVCDLLLAFPRPHPGDFKLGSGPVQVLFGGGKLLIFTSETAQKTSMRLQNKRRAATCLPRAQKKTFVGASERMRAPVAQVKGSWERSIALYRTNAVYAFGR